MDDCLNGMNIEDERRERAMQTVRFLNEFFEEHGRVPTAKEMSAEIEKEAEVTELTYEPDEYVQ